MRSGASIAAIVRGLEGKLESAETMLDVASCFVEAGEAAIGISGFCSFPLFPGAVPEEESLCVSAEHSPAYSKRRMVETFGMADRELGPITVCFQHPSKSFDVNEFLGWDRLLRTDYYNEVWRELGVERELQTCLGTADAPLATFTLSRNIRERPFTTTDVATVELLRQPTERRVARIAAMHHHDAPIGAVLAALHAALPIACAVLDLAGQLVWANRAAENALGFTPTLVGGPCGRAVVTRRPEVTRWASAALDAAARGDRDEICSNGMKAQLIELPTQRAVWLVLDHRFGAQRSLGGLTDRELQVAQLAAHGYTALNVATKLGITEETVRVHLKRVYRKLRIANRAELTRRLLGF